MFFFAAAFKYDSQNSLRQHDFELILDFYENLIREKTGRIPDETIHCILEMYCQSSIYMTVKWVLGEYGKRIDGTMFSCTSMGLKIGSGLGTAIVGWLLDFGGFNGKLAVQSQSCINMLHFMYLWLPMLINILVALLLTQLNVEKANEKLRAQKAIKTKINRVGGYH